MIEPHHPDLSIGQQCKLLSIARTFRLKALVHGDFYHKPESIFQSRYEQSLYKPMFYTALSALLAS